MYESLEGGCVPLVVRRFGPGESAVGTTPLTGPEAEAIVSTALAPLRAVTGEAPPFVVVSHEAELPAALEALARSPEKLDELQRRALKWWARAKAHYAHAFQARICPREL